MEEESKLDLGLGSDPPQIVGKRDRNKPVLIDNDPDNEEETKNDLMARVNR